MFRWQVKPLPNAVRLLPIPGLQKIIGADAAMAKYAKELYEQAEETSSDGRWNLVVCIAAYRVALWSAHLAYRRHTSHIVTR